MAQQRSRQNGWTSAAGRLLMDLVLFNLATVVAVLVRVDFRAAPWPWVYTLKFPGIVENLVFVAASVLVQTPLALWSYTSLRDVERVVVVVAVAKALTLPLLLAMRGQVQWSRGAFAASAVVAFLFMAAVRAARRWWYERKVVQSHMMAHSEQVPAHIHVLVVGAGDAGDMVLREFEAHPELGRVVGLIDDDPAKQGCTMRGVRVLGPVAVIADIARRTMATQAVIAVPSHAAAVTRAVLSNLADTGVQLRTLPGMWELVDGSIHVDDLRPIELEDLLTRVPVSTDLGPVRAYVEGKCVLVTGAGGSIGSEIVRQVARLNPAQLIMLGRGENRIFRIDRELQEHTGVTCAVPVIGDMRDVARMTWLFDTYPPDIIFHAAAHKHVPLMEQNPEEAILNNVEGTRILLRLAVSHGTERFVNISTDKEVNPVNFMGASKRIVELVVQVNDGRGQLRATSVRFGNVLGSKGSVAEVFQKQLAETRTLRVTDPNMERFFMLIPEAVQLVLQAGALSQGNDIFVLRMGDPIRILDLARSYIKLAGLEVGREASIVITGNRGNEKMTEELWSSSERVVPTSYESIMRVECPPCAELSVLRPAVDRLLDAARSHDANAMRVALHAIDPSINIP
ncbi:MAG: polysaccharide biosynthesis protein [Candidatus Cryosericum sp.]